MKRSHLIAFATAIVIGIVIGSLAPMHLGIIGLG